MTGSAPCGAERCITASLSLDIGGGPGGGWWRIASGKRPADDGKRFECAGRWFVIDKIC